MASPESTLFERIEAAVRTRNIAEARKAIRLYLKSEDENSTSRAQVAEWYRRLGLFREGYLHITPKDWKLPRPGSDQELTDQFLWTAYFLDLQGASAYAFKLLQRLAPNSTTGFSIAGTIQMSNYSYAEAVKSFQEYFARYKGAENYAQKMIRISLADSLAGMELYTEARAELEKIPVEAGERFLAGILEQATGEYAASEKKFSEALARFEKAGTFFPSGENTVDSGFLAKWKGVALAGLGRIDEANRSFDQALAILDKSDHRPEILLDVYRCMHLAGFIDDDRARILIAYPGIAPGFIKKLGLKTLPDWIGERNAKIRIYPGRDEWIENGKPRLGIPLEISLLGYIRCADRLGVSIERLKPLLWPEEISAFIQMDARIAKFLGRLKSVYGIGLKVEAGRIHASPSVLSEVGVELGNDSRPWTFAEKNPGFEANAFAEYYGLGRTIAFKYLSEAVSSGKLTKQMDGRRVLYRINL